MHSATTLPASAPAIPVRDQFAPIKVVFLVGIHLGAVTAVWHSTWAAVGVCLLMHAACGGVGICVGYHRLLTHRSFKCPRALEYGLALLASLSMEGGPIEWVAHHRQHINTRTNTGIPTTRVRAFGGVMSFGCSGRLPNKAKGRLSVAMHPTCSVYRFIDF